MDVSYNYYIYVDLDVQQGIKETSIVYYTSQVSFDPKMNIRNGISLKKNALSVIIVTDMFFNYNDYGIHQDELRTTNTRHT